jgi:hypothetical protein
VYRDPEGPIVDTALQESIDKLGAWRGSKPPEETEMLKTARRQTDY